MGGHPDPQMGGGGAFSKKFLSALQASVWSENKGGLGPPGPSPGSATDSLVTERKEREKKIAISARTPLLGHKNDNCLLSCNRFLNFDTPSP